MRVDRRKLVAGMAAGVFARPGLLQAQTAGAGAEPGSAPAWMRSPGEGFSAYGSPSPFEKDVVRRAFPLEGYELVGTSRTPLDDLAGTITPSGLHFERHHNGVPQIDVAKHRLYVTGMVRSALEFSVTSLKRYPLTTRALFIECGGNSAFNLRPEAPQMPAGVIHGLMSNTQWTGVKLSLLLEEAGIDAGASWVIAEGADSAAMMRSIPLSKCLDDAMVALYQNGEAIRPEQGYPMRLLLPGFEGNTQVKWLRHLRIVDRPVEARDETTHYTELLKDGTSRQFVLPLGVKSVILSPSFGHDLTAPGPARIRGWAWTGRGKVTRVEVSDDAGATWRDATLDPNPAPFAVTEFEVNWRWSGRPATLLSRATDESGATQPTRAEWMKPYSSAQPYHNNSIQAWAIDEKGRVANVYV